MDRTDFAVISNLAVEDSFLDEEEAETIDNMRHRYSPSWYTPTHNEDHSKINVIKSDTLNVANGSNPNRHTFDGVFNAYSNHHDTHSIMARNARRRRAHSHHPPGSGINAVNTLSTVSEKRANAAAVEVWKRSKILKDLDWIQDEQLIKIGKIRSSVYLDQLNKDLEFLTKMNVMDYSLLIGIHFRGKNGGNIGKHWDEEKEQNPQRWDTGKLFTYEHGGMCYDRSEEDNDKVDVIQHKDEDMPQKDAIYFGGIIDFLQVYTAKKKMETFVKGLAHERNAISSIDPESYAKRLHAFIAKSCE